MCNWCVQVRCTCVCVCENTPYDSVQGHVRNNASVCTSVSQQLLCETEIIAIVAEWA